MVIGFKKRFVEPILTGTKDLTIREDNAGRWFKGRKMHMYTGGRFSKEYLQFAYKECTGTQNIIICKDNEEGDNSLCILVDGSGLKPGSFPDFYIADGFSDGFDFVEYWLPILTRLPGQLFTGKIIHWTNRRF